MIRHLVALKPRIFPPLRSSVAVSGTAAIILCVPKIRFCNIGGEGRGELGVI
jgi:hypothetical protein